ncbi:MAG TPA: hypothetical protein VM055_06850 [Novosphingobium sp.]|nr:hypothetical protein [Novosphingobium sp.]
MRKIERVSVYCAACETAGPVRSCREAAIAAWNTRKGAECEDAIGVAWHDATLPAPEGKPVMALYRAWNRPDGPLMKHVVWWREGGWRIYPFTTNQGFVERWRELAVA